MTTDIKTSTIWEEVSKIISAGDTGVHFTYRCELGIGEETIVPIKLISIEVKRRYSEQIGDYVFLEVLLPESVFNNQLYPNKDNFIVTLFKEPIGEVATDSDYDREIQSKVYRGSVIDGKNSKLESDNPIVHDSDSLDRLSQKTYTIQLIDQAIEQIQMTYSSGLFVDMATDEFLRGILTYHASLLDVDDSVAIQGVDVVSGTDLEPREHIIIPDQNILASKVADYVQEHCGGVYSTGLSQYIQNNIWYVYPKYNLNRFDEVDKTLTVITVPSTKLAGSERTFSYQDNKLTVISTGKVTQHDDTERKQLTDGVGIRYLRGGTVVDNYVAMKGHDGMISSEDNMVDYTTVNRTSNLKQIPMSPKRITSNHLFEMSRLAKNLGQTLIVEWENSNPELVYPGMPVKYVYLDGETINEIQGVVLGLDYDVVLQGTKITDTRYTCFTKLYLFMEK